MGSRIEWVLIMMVVVLEYNCKWSCCFGCLVEERNALLQIKADINYPDGSSLSFWSKEVTANCCQWHGIKCNPTTRRVVSIEAFSMREKRLGKWYLNASLFLPFEELNSLALGDNLLAGCVESEGFEHLSILNRLKEVSLEENHFENDILLSLSKLPSLKYLFLFDNDLKGSINFHGGFVNLNTLDLEDNNIQNFEENTDMDRISVLPKLENLYLSGNKFNNRTIKSLSGLKRLKHLNLGYNKLYGTIQIDDLNILNNLEELDLSGNNIDGFKKTQGSKRLSQLKNLEMNYIDSKNASNLLQSVGRFSSLKRISFQGNNVTITGQGWRNLSNLECLILDNSYVNKDFLQNIQALTSLKVLSLTNCSISGSLPNQGWCELRNLKAISLAENHLNGILPPCMENLTSLQIIDIRHNQLTGNIGLSPLITVPSLQWLLFSNNQFEVPLSLRPFYNHSNLKILVGRNNKLVADPLVNTPTTLGFQLEVVEFGNCLLTHLDVAPTNFLYFQSHLKTLDLSDNNIGGQFPSWLLENSSRLQVLSLRNNSFVGPLELPSHPNYNISQIDISNNNLEGHIPMAISSVFPHLFWLNMSRNKFGGNHLYHFSNMSYLSMLDLSNNHLSGILKDHLAMNCPILSYFKLSNNNLYGKIPPSFFTHLPHLNELYLDGNCFNGEIPSGSSLMDLSALDVSNNKFTGRIPKWLRNLSSIEAILISKNYLHGTIPTELCNLDKLVLLDLSMNNLSGSVPACLSTSNILHLHANKNKLGGLLPRSLFNSSSMLTLDLRENYFSGSIPSWINNASVLSILLLKANCLIGNISNQLCHLRKLSILDISQNFLSGSIPPCLGNMVFEATGNIELSELRSGVQYVLSAIPHTDLLDLYWQDGPSNLVVPMIYVQDEVNFASKNRYESYMGKIVGFMSGIDLSCNQLIGELPLEIGNLSKILALNFSHNKLSGSIPAEFSNLMMLESLDLSYNNLTGTIPPQLIKLTSLEVFSIAYNNLSGKTPERKDQFGTFEENSYEGNPYLCGPPLKNSCWKIEPTLSLPCPHKDEEDDTEFIDMGTFKTSFMGSYITMLFGIFTILYLNPYWRRTWFYLVEICITTIYYYLVDLFWGFCMF